MRVGLMHVAGDHAFDVVADGGGDEEGLVRGAAEGEDFADVVAEADVEHAIDFIADDEFDVVEDEGAAFLHVHDAAGGADDDVGLMAELFELCGDFGATVGEGEADGLVFGEAAHFGFDLDGELARGDDDEGLEGLAADGRSSFWRMGRPKAAVFPVPVRAWPRTSTPVRATGIIFSWISEGVEKWISAREWSSGGLESELFEGGGEFDFDVMVRFAAPKVGGVFVVLCFGVAFGEIVLLCPRVVGFVFVAHGLNGLLWATAIAIAATAAPRGPRDSP